MNRAAQITELESRVRNVLTEVLAGKILPEQVTMDADMVQELGLDSLQAIQFLLRVEDEFDVELDYENLRLDHLRSVRFFTVEVLMPLVREQ
ncbi:acyl carrier protein (plasmid) [Streptomyces sp. BB1-1-1]|uniref:acyl carrier protein n=1 Tax=Streptomyces sp. BB1-1-1 TaxID=3074430 RepID=UPI002877CA21|nr:acyl carrier protein [Streptomyces sp. BB1-1-1]WND32850.1 acyl carrier protein [Streptomyces sp. BB1-1-1]WND40082.1 acyl carrier protein [Streptomyces sp. BB1-1-1]WND40916.1 acyl carrier protein [Streptomyces sp. BB1-1-1]